MGDSGEGGGEVQAEPAAGAEAAPEQPWALAAQLVATNAGQGRAAWAHSRLKHLTELSVRSAAAAARLTAIICTLGPASAKPEVLDELLAAGMNVARLNFSHGSFEYHAETVRLVREAVDRYSHAIGADWPVAIALDTRGPEIRTGLLQGGATAELLLVEGQSVTLTTDQQYAESSTAEHLYVDYGNITNVVTVGDRVFVDDGLISLMVRNVSEDAVQCEVENGGKLGSRKGVNLPGVPVDLPGVSEKDAGDLRFGVEQGVDMIFASFIRNAQTVRDVRDVLGEDGARIMIISKIENQQGIDNVDEIIEESDGIMIARGDMGIEIPPQKVFVAQKSILAKCNRLGKPVVVATQMLESMVGLPRATRAESSDVANAVLDGADCVMLSGETAKGKFPVLCVRAMAELCREAEAAVWTRQLFAELSWLARPPVDNTEATAAAAVRVSLHSRAAAILVLTDSGKAARLIAKYRPRCPILAITRDAQVARQSNMWRAVIPLHYCSSPLEDWLQDTDLRFQFGISFAKGRGLVRRADAMVLVSGWRSGSGHTNTVRVVYASGSGEEPPVEAESSSDSDGEAVPSAVEEEAEAEAEAEGEGEAAEEAAPE
ncbi:pyruvate kinase-like [Schistocerca americana]|uniref:pyruvate kinase-like n=1 Tax=Schistocerca americana TaxID=7009 RepID=UPI001F4F34BE|nr:pyruvate kinase-like [Schistocerca americana]